MGGGVAFLLGGPRRPGGHNPPLAFIPPASLSLQIVSLLGACGVAASGRYGIPLGSSGGHGAVSPDGYVQRESRVFCPFAV